jgi:hypothetical protein
MPKYISCVAILAGLQLANGFLSPMRTEHSFGKSSFLQEKFDANEYAKSMSSAAIDQMKNLKPEDIDKMLVEMENMNPLQKSALKAMNMDPDMMKKTMEMMKDNPSMVANAQKVMETMSPDELLEQSRKAQEQLKNMTPEDLDVANNFMKTVPEDQLNAAVQTIKDQNTGNADAIDATSDEEIPMEVGPGSSSDSKVVDAMFQVAEYMSEPPTEGGVTFIGFYSLPVIQLLLGDREFDLSMSELKESWADGSLGATRVDRVGFERVWNEVQEYFEQDIMTESRKEAKKKTANKKKNRGSAKTTSGPATPTIGDNLSPEELEKVNDRVKNLSTNEVGSVLDMMQEMDPAQEARLKSMGVDPKLMQQTAAMLKDNPQMREQAQKMMQNMSPDDMLKASQQAQEQMSNMSEDEVQNALDQLKNPPPLE